jgi:L-iditol 2-dehydrogenase
MGHEVCGDVVAVGEGADRGLLGVRVVPAVTAPCGVCDDCLRGFENLCATGHADRTWGTFAEFVRVPAAVTARNLHRVPAGVSDAAAAFLDPLASVLHGWDRLGDRPAPRRLVVVGAGALAFLWAATARLRGVECLIAGRRTDRAPLAERYGARFADVSSGLGAVSSRFDAAVDATGDPAVWSALPALVAPGGRVLLFGGCAPGAVASFDAARLHYAEISLVGAFHSRPADAAAAMRLLASGGVDPEPLLSGRGSLSDLGRFLEAQGRGDGVRYAVQPHPEPGRGAIGR